MHGVSHIIWSYCPTVAQDGSVFCVHITKTNPIGAKGEDLVQG